MLQTFANIFKVPNLRKKILYTIFMLAIVRLGTVIPVPGIDATKLEGLFSQFSGGLGFIDTISGGSLKKMSIFALGILPYINASIIIQLLTVAVPALEKAAKEEDGKQKINKYTRYLAIILAVVQSAGMTLAFGPSILRSTGFLPFFVVVLTMTAGTSILVWIGDKITERGIGNGISLLIFINILSNFPFTLSQLWISLNNPVIFAIVLAAFVLVIGFVVYVQEGERRIPVEYAKRVTGRRTYGGQSTNIPIKANLSGVMPIIFASSILQFPVAIREFVAMAGGKTPDWVTTLLNALNMNHPVGAILYIVLILFFAYFYTTIQFNPIDFAENLKKSGGVISGIRPGQPTVQFMTHTLNYITLVGACFLAVIAFIPVVIPIILNWTVSVNVSNLYFGGTSLLIAVGVALDVLKQIEANMVVRHYKGFLS